MSSSRLTAILKKEDREDLLDYRINSIIRDREDIYLNNNLTSNSTFNVLSEEQNQRTSNRIVRDIKILMKQFLGMYNTTQLRAQVVDLVTLCLENNIMN